MKLPENSLRVGPASIFVSHQNLGHNFAHKLAQPISFWKSFPLPFRDEEEPFDERVTPTFSCAFGLPSEPYGPKKVNQNGENVNYGQLIEVRYMGPPNHPFLIGFFIINHPFWGYPYFWKHPYMYVSLYLYICI